jgi:peptidoglycan biosynthesis protein MviN/MurJ (putative lipid II flippase)
VQRKAPPYELLGWGVFASVLAGAVVLWLDGSWRTALLVVGIGLLALATLALAVLSGSSRPRRPPPP